MSEIVWQDPPAISQRGDFDGIIRQLQTRPGAWALVATSVGPSFTYGLKRRGAEARSKSTGVVNRYDIYARWPVAS